MNRRRTTRGNRGRIHAGGGLILLPSVFTSGVSVIQSVQGDVGFTNSGGVSPLWKDISGAGLDYTAAGAGQPTYNQSGLNGNPTALFNGSSQFMTSPLNLPAPGTRPTALLMVMRIIAWANTSWIVGPGDASIAMTLHETGVSPEIAQYNGVDANLNFAATVGSWVRLYSVWSNSSQDTLKIGPTIAAGTNSGNTAPGSGRVLAGRSTGLSLANIEVAAMVYLGGIPSTADLVAFDAAVRAKYGPTVRI